MTTQLAGLPIGGAGSEPAVTPALIGWILLVVPAGTVGTEIVGWSGTRAIVILQALTPYLLAVVLAVAVTAFVAQAWSLGTVASAIVVAAGRIGRPYLFPASGTPVDEGATPLRVFHGNLLYENGRPTDLVPMLCDLDVDVLAFTEYTAAHSALLHGSPIARDYPHRIEHPGGATGGSAIWSKPPLTEAAVALARSHSSAAVIDVPQPIALFVVHPPSPIMSLEGWNRELDALSRDLDPTSDRPTITVGDFNADLWHPPFRRILERGWRDAHLVRRRWLSWSWPTDRRPVRPFVRLDHALVNARLVVDGVHNVDVPGSDHRGLVVTVRVAAGFRAAAAV